MIQVERDDVGTITSMRVGGEKLESDDGEVWFLPKGLVGEAPVTEIPDGVSFEICKAYEEGTVILDNIPFRLHRVGPSKIGLVFEDVGTRKYWDGAVGFKVYMEAKKSIVEERAAEIGDLHLDSYDDDGAWIHLTYSAEVEADRVSSVIDTAEQIIAEVEGAAEMRLGNQLWKPQPANDEKVFTLRTVLPLLRKLRFTNVAYHHGKREYGRDVLFARITEFSELEYWGAQIKHGDVSGAAAGEIDEILGQIDDAFKMPFYDLCTKQKQRISKMAIIISGRFTANAIEKICEKIENHATRNNLIFVDGERIESLAQRLWSSIPSPA